MRKGNSLGKAPRKAHIFSSLQISLAHSLWLCNLFESERSPWKRPRSALPPGEPGLRIAGKVTEQISIQQSDLKLIFQVQIEAPVCEEEEHSEWLDHFLILHIESRHKITARRGKLNGKMSSSGRLCACVCWLSSFQWLTRNACACRSRPGSGRSPRCGHHPGGQGKHGALPSPILPC